MDADDRFDVVLLGFSVGSAEPPAAALKRVFGIDDAAAQKILANLPRTVQKHVPHVRAEYFRRALAAIGAEVEVRDRDGRAIGFGEHEQSDPLGWDGEATASPRTAASPAAHAATIVRAPAPETIPSHDFGTIPVRARATIAAAEVADSPHTKTIVDEHAASPIATAAGTSTATVIDEQAPAPPGSEPTPKSDVTVIEQASAPPGSELAPKSDVTVIDEQAPRATSELAETSAAKQQDAAPLAAARRVPAPEPAAVRPVRPAATTPPNPARSTAVAPPRQPSTAHAAATSVPHIDTRSFWATIGDALSVPFRGSAVYWLVGISIWSVVVGLLATLAGFFPMPVVGLIVTFLAQTSLVAFACDFFKVCMWVPTTGEEVVDQLPRLDPERILDTYILSGLHLTIFSLVSMIPLIAWFASELSFESMTDLDELTAFALHPVTWLVLVFPSLYWPVGVGLTALANDFAAIWNVPLAFRALGRAPLEILTIVAVGWAVFGGSWLLLALSGSSMGVPGFLLQSSGGFPLALSHGMMGALFGHLVRSQADLLD